MTPAVFLTILCLGVASCAPSLDPSLDAEWKQWKRQYQKSYSPEQELAKRAVWEENAKMIKLHNAEYKLGKNSFTMEINAYADMTKEELGKMTSHIPIQTHRKGKSIRKRSVCGSLPTRIDWERLGSVTPVRDQDYCNSCWAFAVTGAIEGQMFNKTQKLIPLSVQNLVDCSKPQGNNGCVWGDPYSAYEYVLHNGGLEAEATYPYEGKEGLCRYNPNNSIAEITGIVSLPESEDSLMEAVARIGPISAGVDISPVSFSFYRRGIYQEPKCSNNSVNHVVLVVGYGKEIDGTKYWRIRNSWGKNWGMRGYMKIARNKNNQCGIASYAHYPTV